MEIIALLSYIQKNRRLLQNLATLSESFLPLSAGSFEELCLYLKEEEDPFYQHFFKDSSGFRRELDEVDKLQREGVHFTFPGDRLYPSLFLHMPGAPLLLNFVGHPAWLPRKNIAVVGSRDAVALSRNWMEENFAEFLKLEKPVVVSGGARGVDQWSHQLALRNHCPTVVVLPSGLGDLYPKTLHSWQSRIIEGGGCLISEYSFMQTMQKHYFHDRNRLIAGLGVLTLLIEAKRRSGSLLTAQKTLQLGKPVLIVPGHPSDTSHLGNLDLLSDGATPVRDAQDLCMYFKNELKLHFAAGPIASDALLS